MVEAFCIVRNNGIRNDRIELDEKRCELPVYMGYLYRNMILSFCFYMNAINHPNDLTNKNYLIWYIFHLFGGSSDTRQKKEKCIPSLL